MVRSGRRWAHFFLCWPHLDYQVMILPPVHVIIFMLVQVWASQVIPQSLFCHLRCRPKYFWHFPKYSDFVWVVWELTRMIGFVYHLVHVLVFPWALDTHRMSWGYRVYPQWPPTNIWWFIGVQFSPTEDGPLPLRCQKPSYQEYSSFFWLFIHRVESSFCIGSR
jgi:hypothetical protein